jgi:hypothetical protein
MGDDQRVGSPTTSDVVARAHSRGYGCNQRARRHELSYRRWRLWGTLLSILSAIGSTIAASSLLFSTESGSAGAVLAGVVGLLAAIVIAVNTALNMAGRADEHRVARAAFINLRTRYYMLRDLPPADYETAAAQLATIELTHAEVEAESPPPEKWTAKRIETKSDSSPKSPSAELVPPSVPTDTTVSES